MDIQDRMQGEAVTTSLEALKRLEAPTSIVPRVVPTILGGALPTDGHSGPDAWGSCDDNSRGPQAPRGTTHEEVNTGAKPSL